MSKFKDQRRIDAAIDHGNKTELEWALWYCKMRLDIATRKHSEKHWQAIERKVLAAIEKVHQKEDADRE